MEVKWWERQHLKQIAQVLALGYPDESWTEEDVRAFVNDTRHSNVCKVLVDKRDRVWGVLLTTHAKRCRVRRLTIHHSKRGRGMATFLLSTLTGPRSSDKEHTIVARVHERDLVGQKLFRRAGFVVSTDQPHQKDDKGEDIYLFTFVKPEARVLATQSR